ncbi:hypothetical protein LSA36186_15110 [Lachnoanaerobaculum sp. JCM 36186]|nr:hypothetical protein [Lachnoanaerobaculum sp. JCM 36186]GMO03262.1 hypothetical protein LSA36186_15110 [Lachnoanaerobaculum sp. JCM 36186]
MKLWWKTKILIWYTVIYETEDDYMYHMNDFIIIDKQDIHNSAIRGSKFI